jgi:hypothetical protein
VTKKKENNETKSEIFWNMGLQPLHPTLMNAEQNEKKWKRNCFVRREMRSLGIPFSKSVVVDRDG